MCCRFGLISLPLDDSAADLDALFRSLTEAEGTGAPPTGGNANPIEQKQYQDDNGLPLQYFF